MYTQDNMTRRIELEPTNELPNNWATIANREPNTTRRRRPIDMNGGYRTVAAFCDGLGTNRVYAGRTSVTDTDRVLGCRHTDNIANRNRGLRVLCQSCRRCLQDVEMEGAE